MRHARSAAANPRSCSPLKPQLDKDLAKYVAAASAAAGLGLLAGAMPAQAEVVYTPASQVIERRSTFHLDINNDGITDFTFKEIQVFYMSSAYTFLEVNGNQAGNHPIASNNGFFAAALPQGYRIGRGDNFQGSSVYKRMGSCVTSNGVAKGPFGEGKRLFLGVKFFINGEKHFGWVRFNVKNQDCNLHAVMTGYAYETIPRKAIHTPQPKNGDSQSDGLSLGHLALGKSMRDSISGSMGK
jgi:hypothetical protein